MTTRMDRLTQATNVFSRTLYKHIGSNIVLLVEVPNGRDRRLLLLLEMCGVETMLSIPLRTR